jgi:hypothetical protein
VKGKEKITMNDLRLFFANTSNVKFEPISKIKPLEADNTALQDNVNQLLNPKSGDGNILDRVM